MAFQARKPLRADMSARGAMRTAQKIVDTWTHAQRNRAFASAWTAARNIEPKLEGEPRTGILKAILHKCYYDESASPWTVQGIRIHSPDDDRPLRIASILGRSALNELSTEDLRWYIREMRKMDPLLKPMTQERHAIRVSTSDPEVVTQTTNDDESESPYVPSMLQCLPLEIHAQILRHVDSLVDVHSATKATRCFRNALPLEIAGLVPQLLNKTFWAACLTNQFGDDDMDEFEVDAEYEEEENERYIGMSRFEMEKEMEYVYQECCDQVDDQDDDEEQEEVVDVPKNTRWVQKRHELGGKTVLGELADFFSHDFDPQAVHMFGPTTYRARRMLAIMAMIIDYVDVSIQTRCEAMIEFRCKVEKVLDSEVLDGERPVFSIKREACSMAKYRMYTPFADFHSIDKQFECVSEAWVELRRALMPALLTIALKTELAADYGIDLLNLGPDGIFDRRFESPHEAAGEAIEHCLTAPSGLDMTVRFREDRGPRSFCRHMLNAQLASNGVGFDVHVEAGRSAVRRQFFEARETTWQWALQNLEYTDRLKLRLTGGLPAWKYDYHVAYEFNVMWQRSALESWCIAPQMQLEDYLQRQGIRRPHMYEWRRPTMTKNSGCKYLNEEAIHLPWRPRAVEDDLGTCYSDEDVMADLYQLCDLDFDATTCYKEGCDVKEEQL